MDEAFAITAVTVMAVAKVGLFAAAVRRALRPRPNPAVEAHDQDGPDWGWRWWDEFDPEPQPPEPTGHVGSPPCTDRSHPSPKATCPT